MISQPMYNKIELEQEISIKCLVSRKFIMKTSQSTHVALYDIIKLLYMTLSSLFLVYPLSHLLYIKSHCSKTIPIHFRSSAILLTSYIALFKNCDKI